jgi:glycosyltransferase involved in cell wall biosynthesis
MTEANRSGSEGADVTIVMATYQGERFLAQQLDSIAAQTHRNWRLHVSDDGSTDGTATLIRAFGERVGPSRVTFVAGPRKGYAYNFLTALSGAPDAAFFAFADQDDIWHPDKLERALAMLKRAAADRPALYCGRTTLVDEEANPIGMSPLFDKAPAFANALVQNIGGGNTMVFDRRARNALAEVFARCGAAVFAHDWWVYQLITGMGGSVSYDAAPALLYRQHGGNLIGKNNGWKDRADRVVLLMRGRFREWSERNVLMLDQAQHLLTPHNRDILARFKQVREGSLIVRLSAFRRAGLYRQTFLGNMGLVFAVVFNKL